MRLRARALTLSLLASAIVLATPNALAQSTQPAIFVGNNGNCEGSATSFLINPDGTLSFVQKLVTGAVVCGSGDWHPGLNAGSISLSPSGEYLCTGHLTAASIWEQLTILRVNADATMSVVHTQQTPDTPIDVKWISDEFLAVTSTPPGLPDSMIIYRWDPSVPSLTQVTYEPIADFSFYYIAMHPSGQFIYGASAAGGGVVKAFSVNPTTGFLTQVGPMAGYPTGIYPLGPGISPDGTKLYFGGGISSSGGLSSRWIGGFNIDPATGALETMPDSPYLSPPSDGTSGPSPKEVVVSSDNQFAFVNHGGTAHIKGFNIDQKTGRLTPIASSYFNVGGQGDSGNMAILGNRLFVTRKYSSATYGPTGVISLVINNDGSLTQTGGTFSTTGTTPTDLVLWPGLAAPCPADLAPPGGDGSVGVSDLLALIAAWGAAGGPADLNGDGIVAVGDLLALIAAWGDC